MRTSAFKKRLQEEEEEEEEEEVLNPLDVKPNGSAIGGKPLGKSRGKPDGKPRGNKPPHGGW